MKKKGFTLVELLATLVILSVIALITVPVILNVIESSRKKAAMESFKGYMQASEEVVAEDDMEDESSLTQPDEEGCYPLVDLDKLVSIKGVHPTISGEKKVCFHEGALTFLHSVIINGYEIWYDGEIHINKEGDENPDDPPSYMPTDEEPRTQVTTKSIKVINQQTVKIGEITEVEYAIKKSSDSTWGEWKTDDTSENYYLFDNLDSNTYYDVKTRVKTARKKEYVESKVLKVKTNSIPLPTFEEKGNTTTKTVTITFGSGLTNRYKKETDKTWTTVTGSTKEVLVDDNITIYAESTDGKNTVNSSHTVTGIVKGAGIPSGSYQPGTTIKYAGLDWLVIKDNGNTTTLILKNNYTTGAFGTSTSFASGNNAYTQVNTNFVNAHDVVKKDIEGGMIILDSSTNSYVRLPKKDELSTKIPNGSSTAFWTLTSSGNNLYYGVPNGGYNYTTSSLGSSYTTYYYSYSTSNSGVPSMSVYDTISTTVSYPTTSFNSPSVSFPLVSSASYYLSTGKTSEKYGGERIEQSGLSAGTYSGSMSCSGGHVVSVSSGACGGYTCGHSTSGSYSYSVGAKSGTMSYCNGSYNWSIPAHTITLSGSYYSNVSSAGGSAQCTGSGAYRTCTCPSQSISISGAPQYFGGSGNANSLTLYMSTTSGCTLRSTNTNSSVTWQMGIRPVITIKEK